MSQNNVPSLKLDQYRFIDRNQKKYLVLILSFCDQMYIRITSQENCCVLTATAVDLKHSESVMVRMLSDSGSSILSDIWSSEL